MDSTTVIERSKVTARELRPLLGRPATIRTTSSIMRGTLLSCVKGSLWLVVDDDDVVLPLDDIAWLETGGRLVLADA